MKITSNPLTTRLASWILALSLIGYPLAGLMSSLLNWDSTRTSYPFRAIVFVFAILLWVRVPTKYSWVKPSAWLLLFWVLYLGRLVWDHYIAEIPGALEALTFFLIVVLGPCIALAAAAFYLQEKSAAQAILVIGGIANIVAISMLLFGFGLERSLLERTSRLSFEALNPITIGHTAVTTLIAVLALSKYKPKFWVSLLLIIPVAAAVACLAFAVSRGALVSLAACIFTLVMVRGHRRLRIGVLLATVSGAFYVYAQNPNLRLIVRFSRLNEDLAVLQRFRFQNNAIEQFYAHPILGSAFVDLKTFQYPHNLFIECAMALGVIGLAALLMLIFWAALWTWQRMQSGEILIPLLVVQYLVGANFSGSLWGASFWIPVAVVFGYQVVGVVTQPRIHKVKNYFTRRSVRLKAVGSHS